MLRDYFGNSFAIGDIIAYPGSCGSSLWVTIAIVVGIGDERLDVVSTGKGYDDEWSTPRKTFIERTDRAIRLCYAAPVDVRELLAMAALQRGYSIS